MSELVRKIVIFFETTKKYSDFQSSILEIWSSDINHKEKIQKSHEIWEKMLAFYKRKENESTNDQENFVLATTFISILDHCENTEEIIILESNFPFFPEDNFFIFLNSFVKEKRKKLQQ